MTSLESKIPPLILTALVAVLMWFVSLVTPDVVLSANVRLLASIIALAIGIFFCAAGVISFRLAKTTVDPRRPEAASALVSSGIYRVSRNPMYVGFASLLIAWAIFLASMWSFAGVAVFVLYIDRLQIAPEERALTAIFGSEFINYKSRVRRWL